VVLESAECKATGGAEVLEGLKGGAKGSAPVQDSVQVPTGEASRGVAGAGAAGAAGVDVGGGGGLLPAGDGAPDGDLAAASPGMGGDDAKRRRTMSATLQV
jgi:hypothetical protein